jgi:hypothetical protein
VRVSKGDRGRRLGENELGGGDCMAERRVSDVERKNKSQSIYLIA